MVQSVFLFALGFLVASLLALLTAPLIWRRAQLVMRRRLEAVVPMTVDEVRADRDALRAQHAMSARKLEVEVEELRGLHAAQRIEIGRGREVMKARNRTLIERESELENVRGENERLTTQLRGRERDLAASELQHRVNEREGRGRRERMEATIEALRRTEIEVEEKSIALAEREVELAEASRKQERLTAEIASMRDTIAALRERLDDSRPMRTRGAPQPAADASEMEARLAAESERASAAEIEAAGLRLRVDELNRALNETDKELREDLAELAARVTQLVAEVEGPGSPIPALVEGSDPGSLGERVERLLAFSKRGRRTALRSAPRPAPADRTDAVRSDTARGAAASARHEPAREADSTDGVDELDQVMERAARDELRDEEVRQAS